ncbi:MAG: hypothetical protein U9O89_00685 [Thermoproteota archaeon]|nr:hypothetical protein [Thermoproteota archaeon]
MSILESGVILAYAYEMGRIGEGWGLVGLGVGILATIGVVMVYKGIRLAGALITFFSTLVGQLSGGAIGLALWVLIGGPTARAIFNTGLRFAVPSGTILSLIGSVTILAAIWKSRREVA